MVAAMWQGKNCSLYPLVHLCTVGKIHLLFSELGFKLLAIFSRHVAPSPLHLEGGMADYFMV